MADALMPKAYFKISYLEKVLFAQKVVATCFLLASTDRLVFYFQQ
jgi:hypothetical protein